jgi:hypothetical protein
MRKFLTVPAILSLTISAAVAELDLTPRPMSVGAGLIQRACFGDGRITYAVTIKDDVKVSASEGGALFHFTNFSQASMRLRRSPMPKGLAFDTVSLPEYLKAAEKMLPASAEAMALTAQAENVFPINRWKSYRFTFGYQVGGMGYQEDITFLVMDSGEQMVIQTGSQRKDFETIGARADDIIRRWHEVLPGDEEGAN